MWLRERQTNVPCVFRFCVVQSNLDNRRSSWVDGWDTDHLSVSKIFKFQTEVYASTCHPLFSPKISSAWENWLLCMRFICGPWEGKTLKTWRPVNLRFPKIRNVSFVISRDCTNAAVSWSIYPYSVAIHFTPYTFNVFSFQCL